MGKHERGYARVARDLYPTPSWVVDCLDQHFELKGQRVWECAAGRGHMVRALRKLGAHVLASDVVKRRGIDRRLDFVGQEPNPINPAGLDWIITNPPFGQGGRLAVAFIEAGLTRLAARSMLALLLPCDFDSASTRSHLFGKCPRFVGKIVLRRRVVWFKRHDGVREAPKENTAWFLWNGRGIIERPRLLYAP